MKYLVLFLMSMFPLLSISAQNLEKKWTQFREISILSI